VFDRAGEGNIEMIRKLNEKFETVYSKISFTFLAFAWSGQAIAKAW
jgi:hypothetical protein